MNLPKKVQINEVVLRDGLQLEDKVLTVDEKKILFDLLVTANVQSLEFGSFVHPKLVPQMANSGDLFELISKEYDHLKLIALIPNLKGARNAHEKGVAKVNFVFSASDTHNQQNVQKSTEESLRELKEILSYCEEHAVLLNVSIATTFGCPFEGEVKKDRIHWILEQLMPLKIETITLADTTGMANPQQVYDLVSELRNRFPEQAFNLHFHNTRGMGLANMLSAMEAGITSFDASLGGLGGCPFAPGATGNICTEDVVHMLHSMGIETGLSLEGLLSASRTLQQFVGHETPSYVLKAGPYDRKYPAPVKK
ncbi:hydroxymethylglutaryl-CoA lyase [Planococcus sp. ISL-110]|uniref:hydroxymethylglutaryl-CoA lyase n=1 Tax=Planococcus sp. ISL-110 TaxID=2819167 RepID=UPI001BE9300F|nr:hydroxymethylglutaryl-CoA lyase [Planococcus sp. ISL-110]MBT2569422.1 hydroxymethylglutaryl-CoA lyase [Planococcus sp. ISL-110]